MNARFAAIFTGDSTTIHSAAEALADPTWGIWFGRKSCVPALPLSPVIGETPGAALASLLTQLSEWDGGEAIDPDSLECWEEPEISDRAEGDFFLNDTPVSFKDRHFVERPVRHRRATGRDDRRVADSKNVSEAFFDALPDEGQVLPKQIEVEQSEP